MQNRAGCCLLILIAFFLHMGCSDWSPSDNEAVMLVRDYYLFFYSGKDVEVKIIHRGEYIKENKCYPIEFMIVSPEQEGYKKTFYFFKNEQGNVAIREFQFG